MRSPIVWFGGKGLQVHHLLSLLPAHHTYVEPFVGGGSLFFAKSSSPVEVLNDLDGDLVHFYRVLRDPACFEAFHRRISLTPYARAEYVECRETWQACEDPVERAARWFIWARMSFSASSGWSFAITESRRGMSKAVSTWLGTIEGLSDVHVRLQVAQIECQDWRGILNTYDTPETFFYLDPPYIPATRRSGGYVHELTADDHADLIARCLQLQGMVLLSGYAHPLYAPLAAAGWIRHDFDVTCSAVGRTRHTGLQGKGSVLAAQTRVESVWRNPAALATPQAELFDA